MQEIIYDISEWKRFSDMQTAKLEKRFNPFTIEIRRLDAVSRSQQEYIFGVVYPHLREGLTYVGYDLKNIDDYQFDYFMRKMFYFDIVTTRKGEEKVPRRLNFAKGKKEEVTKYIDDLLAFGAQIGCYIPSPTNPIFNTVTKGN